MPLQVELLEQSFNYIKPYGNLFVNNFYENLFKVNPELKYLFTNLDPETKKNQLWRDLVLLMENLRQPEMLKNILHGLGARLFTDGALPEHYPLIKNAFFSSFAQFLGGEWTPDLKQAWDDAYVDFRDLMFEGAENTCRQMARISPVADSKEKLGAVPSKDHAIEEELLSTPIPEVKEAIAEIPAVVNTDNSIVELPENIAEEVETVSSKDDALEEELLSTPIHEVKEAIAEIPAVVDPDNSIVELPENIAEEVETFSSKDDALEEFLSTPIPELEEAIAEVPAVVNPDNSLVEELSETPDTQLQENITETPAVASSEDSLTKEVLDTPLTKSATIMEEQVIIEDIDLSLEQTTLGTTMPESDNNIPQNDTIKNQDEVPLAKNTSDHPLEDLSEKLQSETIEPHFTQIFIPESQPEPATTSSATATAVKSVASETSYQPEIKTGQSNKGLLIGGGVAGAVGLLLLLLL